MAKAEYRRSDVDALRPSTQPEAGGHAAGTSRVPTASRPETADALRDAILQLYRQLASADAVGTGGRRAGNSLAYHAIEAQIRTLAARHWQITGGHTITHSPKSTVAPSTVGIPRPRRFFVRRTAERPDVTIASLLT